MHAGVIRAQGNPTLAREQTDEYRAHQSAVENQLKGIEMRRGELHANPHRRKERCTKQHPEGLHGGAEAQVEGDAIFRRYHSWKCCMPSSMGLW